MRARGFLFFISAVMLVGPLAAGPVARQSVIQLAGTADAIVAGSVVATVGNGIVSAAIQVERVLKGSPTLGTTISSVWMMPPSEMPAGSGPPLNGHGVFFLQQTAGGAWNILPWSAGDIAWRDTYIPTPSTAPTSLREVASASLSPASSAVDRVFLEMVITIEAGSPTSPVAYDLIDDFQQTHSAVLAAAFNRFLSNQDPNLRSVGLRGALLNEDPATILTVRQNYAALSSTAGWQDLLDQIKFYYLNTGSQAVQILGQLATDVSVGLDLRIATGIALARMHTQQTLPYLAALLNDPNPTLETAAVGGMASFANHVPIGSHEPAAGAWQYRTDDTIAHSAFDEVTVQGQASYYIQYWKSWWQQNQPTLMQP
jgi:hypothetical protein